MPEYTVKQGDCMSSIAHKFGFADPKKIWERSENDELRKKRHDFNLLYPGDVLFIPERTDKKEQLKPGQKQKIQVSLPKKKLHLVLLDAKGKPRANLDYVLKAGNETLKGNTGGGGAVDQLVSADVETATLTLGKEVMTLHIGKLNPVDNTPDDGISGIQARLKNLGLLAGEIEGFVCQKTQKAVKAFQKWYQLEVTGTIDDVFRKTLELAHRNEKKPPEPKKEEKKAGGGKAPAALGVEEKDKLPDIPDLCTTYPRKKAKEEDKGNSVAANIANVLKPARKGTCDKCKDQKDCLDNDYNFLLSVAHMAESLGGNASHFMGIMHYETGHKFDPAVKNGIGATGLIQIIPETAKGLKTTTGALADMCRIEQLDYVEKYFTNQKQAFPKADYNELTDVVLAVFEPAGLNPNHELLGVDEDKCDGPFLTVDGKETEISEDMVTYYEKNGGNQAKDKGVLKDDSGNVVGISRTKWRNSRHYTAKYKGDTVTLTPYMLAVYSGNSGLDTDKDGFLLRSDYPRIVGDQILKKCGKDSCAKAAELQKQLSSSKLIICTSEDA